MKTTKWFTPDGKTRWFNVFYFAIPALNTFFEYKFTYVKLKYWKWVVKSFCSKVNRLDAHCNLSMQVLVFSSQLDFCAPQISIYAPLNP